MASIVQVIPSHLLDYILEYLDVPDLLRTGRVCHEFLEAYRRVLSWQRVKWGPRYHADAISTFWARITAGRRQQCIAENWQDLNRNRIEIRRANDIITALILTCTGLFVVSCVKPLLNYSLFDLHHVPTKLVGPCLVLYAVLLVVFEEASPSKLRRRNRLILLIAGLTLSGWDLLDL